MSTFYQLLQCALYFMCQNADPSEYLSVYVHFHNEVQNCDFYVNHNYCRCNTFPISYD